MPAQISRRRALLIGTVTAAVGAGLVIANSRLGHVFRVLQNPAQLPPFTMPTVISRAEWGARPPDHQALNEFGFAQSALDPEWYVYTESLVDVYNTVVIHHSASPVTSNETMADIQNSHMDVNGWADIAYHYGIDKDGVVYEGRDIGARGASVAGYNTGTIGVVVMGNFEQDDPLAVQMTALQVLVNGLTSTYLLSHLAGHGEFNPESVCPGNKLILYLDQLAQNAGLARGTAGHIPPSA